MKSENIALRNRGTLKGVTRDSGLLSADAADDALRLCARKSFSFFILRVLCTVRERVRMPCVLYVCTCIRIRV